MRIFINNVLQKTQILPSYTPTLDETLDTFSFALISNDIATPFAPMQPITITNVGDSNETLNFVIASDSVETYSLKPLRYKHNISCIQNTRVLSKHLVRNSVFTQPAYLTKSSFNAMSRYGTPYNNQGGVVTFGNPYLTLNDKSEKLTLKSSLFSSVAGLREKVKKAYFKMSFQFVQRSKLTGTINTDYNHPITCDAHSIADIMASVPTLNSLWITSSLTLRYRNSSNTLLTETIRPSDFGLNEWDLNETYEFARIEELASQGCNNFELYFTNEDFLHAEFKANYSNPLIEQGKEPNIEFYMVQVQIIAETYYYTAYDVLEILLRRQSKRCQSVYKGVSNVFRLPLDSIYYTESQREAARLLENTIAPNFTFTGLTMYECVAEVFRLFDAIFTMDTNGYLGVEYFNDLSKGEIPEANRKFVGSTLAWGEDKYTNGLVANYQDARIIETFPKNGKFMNLRSIEFGVPEKQDFNFIVPHNIKSIVKCELLCSSFQSVAGGGYSGWTATGNLVLDITRQVVEQSVWSSLPTGALNYQDVVDGTVKQASSIYYQEGSNAIQVAYSAKSSWNVEDVWSLWGAAETVLMRMSGMNTMRLLADGNLQGAWQYVKMRVTYICEVDGKTKVHSTTNKYNGETLIDQANGAVDLNKMGLNMLGLSLKLGNPTLNATQKITSWANRVVQGQYYIYQGDLWIANVVNYTFLNKTALQAKISFVKNFNQLSLRTQLLREKRMTNISSSLVQKSEEIVTDFIYFSSESINGNGEDIFFDYTQLDNFMRDSFSLSKPSCKLGDAFVYTNINTAAPNAIYIPMITYGAGNTVNFEMSFDHPMNAGNQTKSTTSWAGVVLTTKFFTKHVVYTNEDGMLESISFRAPTSYNDFNDDFPKVTIPTSGYYFNIPSYYAFKQPNEILALNYQIAFLPLPGRENIDFIGPEFINNNCFVKDLTGNSAKKLYICGFQHKLSILDTKIIETPYTKREVTSVYLNRSGESGAAAQRTLRFNFAQTSAVWNGTLSWALVDENDNVLFATNGGNWEYNRHYVNINFITKRNRLS